MWRKVPVWTRAIVTGLIVTAIPTSIWAAMATLNVRVTPRMPWAALVMAAVLWLYWRLLRRDERLRGRALAPAVWRLALLASGAGVAAVWASFAALRGMLHVAPPAADVTAFPMVVVAAMIVMGAAVASLCEEAGFRGFMQLPLERAYGPVPAIGVSSIVFTLAHLTHGRAVLPFLPFYFVAAIVYGTVTFLTGSILPSMALHFGGDVLLFALRYVAAREGAAATGATGMAIVPAIAALAFATISAMVFRLLARRARGIGPITIIPALGH